MNGRGKELQSHRGEVQASSYMACSFFQCVIHEETEALSFLRRQSNSLQIWRYKFFILIGGSLLWARIKDGDGNEINHMSDSLIFQKFTKSFFENCIFLYVF